MKIQVLRYEKRGSDRVLSSYLLGHCEWSAVSEYEEQDKRVKVRSNCGTPFYDIVLLFFGLVYEILRIFYVNHRNFYRKPRQSKNSTKGYGKKL